MEEDIQTFRRQLLEWHAFFDRPLPWKGEKDPYLVWLSEVILQQTRVEQGLPYFEKFKLHYPTLSQLAAANDDEVMKKWEGLGYYSRARNMLATARLICNEHGGAFPNTYKELLRLKGIGPYTAAAIASFAYDLPFAVLDGNVFRVLARYWGISTPIDSTEGRKIFAQKAQAMLEQEQPAQYNQAIMDLGARICTPRRPQCASCPVQNQCSAYRNGNTHILPVKQKKIIRKERYFNYCVITDQQNQTWVRKRIEKDIWQQLYEFPLVETPGMISDPHELMKDDTFKTIMEKQSYQITNLAGPFKQELTHQRIIANFWEIKLDNNSKMLNHSHLIKTDKKKLDKFAFPKVIDCYLSDNSLYLYFAPPSFVDDPDEKATPSQ